MNGFKIVLVASALALTAGSASAAILNFTTGVGQGGNRVSSPIGSSENPTNVFSGTFNMTEDGDGSKGSLGLGTTFVAFCMDILTTMRDGQEYEINNATPFNNDSGATLSQLLAGSTRLSLVQNLFDSAYGTLSGNADTAAFGLALWEIAHETADPATDSLTTLNVTAGNFSVSTDDASVATTANTFLAGALSYGAGKKYNIDFIQNVRGVGTPSGTSAQNLVAATVVPLPAAGLLLFGALGALGLTSRRRKAASEA